MKDAFVAIHGHFYQPPRENPWLEAVEREESASPFHDWNERIAFECYWPNAYARIVDGEGKILHLINNYSSISFNFGPTLLPWIEKRKPHLYRRILEADREGLRRFGCGNAMAQVYHHIILPLANERDKETEVLWGLTDFEKRFHRKAEAIWLPETAVNYPTLGVLIKHGMRYLLLSPFQARRVKPLGGRKWMDVSQGKIDTAQPYRCFLKGPCGEKLLDHYLDIFFYHGTISREVSFGNLLKDGNLFCDRFMQAYQPSRKGPQLIHIATDGETYGHHKEFGEMALAYALHQGFPSRGLEIINYGAFLKRFPPTYEVEIDEGPKGEGTSWSCSHGVGRWKEDCGCTTGGKPGWNQKWRRPLREALDLLRDELSLLFEREGEKVFRDVWEARNAYIEVILDPSPEEINRFFEREGLRGIDESAKIRGLKLLEMQRHALQMFTSCGWFFADLGGLETGIILRHAARAIQLAKELTGRDLEDQFLRSLSEAKSNLDEKGNGSQIFHRFVRPGSVLLEQVVNHFAITSFLEGGERQRRIFSFKVEGMNEEKMEEGNYRALIGEVEVTSHPALEKKSFIFGLIFSKRGLFRTWISEGRDSLRFDQLRERSLESFRRGEEELVRTFTSLLGTRVYTLRDTFREERNEIFQRLIEKELQESLEIYAVLFDRTKETAEALAKEGLEIPYEIRVAAEATLSHHLLAEARRLVRDFKATIERGEIDRILEEADQYGYHLRKEEAIQVLNEMLREKMEILHRLRDSDLSDQKGLAEEIMMLLDLSGRWGFQLSKDEAQGLMGEILDQCINGLEEYWWGNGDRKPFPPVFITLAEKLGFNTEKFSKMVGP